MANCSEFADLRSDYAKVSQVDAIRANYVQISQKLTRSEQMCQKLYETDVDGHKLRSIATIIDNRNKFYVILVHVVYIVRDMCTYLQFSFVTQSDSCNLQGHDTYVGKC